MDRRELLKASAAVVGFSMTGLPAFAQGASAAVRRAMPLDQADSFIAFGRDGTVTVFSGKVDLGTGHRVAMRQMVGEELGTPMHRIELIEGDTGLTPNQGPTAGSTGVMRGGVELRQAAATMREGLVALAADRLKKPADALTLEDGVVSASDGTRVTVGELASAGPLNLKMNPKAPLKKPAQYKFVGQPLPRPDIPAKVTGRFEYVHDVKLPGMLHARIVRPPAVGAKVVGVDEASVGKLPGVRVVRMNDFVAVLSPDEWAAIRAQRELKVQWSDSAPLIGSSDVADWARRGPFVAEETIVNKGDAARIAAMAGAQKVSATYFWPIQSHASMGPSCAVADVKPEGATIWSASQATHRLVNACAAVLDMPRDKVRVIYADGAGCYGTNGHDDATAEAAMLSKAAGAPVRVQWSREEELGWDPKGPPQLLAFEATLTPQGRIDAWHTDMWLPRATANLEWIPLVSPLAAGLKQPQGQAVGLVSQNGDPPYGTGAIKVDVHWLGPAPLRPSNIRAPGKVGNGFAVESFTDELAAEAKMDPIAFRLQALENPRGREVIERLAKLMQWQPRPSPGRTVNRRIATGRGMAYMHYKHNETFVAVGMEVQVDRASGELRVARVACAHDCGLMINPDAVRAQVEGNILQTLSRTLLEETQFDRSRVTNVTWADYPILRFTEVPRIDVDLIQRLDQPPLGAGEAAASAVPAALGNALFDATGVRAREVPFTRQKLRALLA
ncbi:xanthine dehydrogenase family protein molybdopterin-binding subunit [Ramlibacter sp. PS4R-6]|uniref:xanthine dehydrogenase family protein molybdopterin-binding subunit n=1 Tax=Ramlibacter sp. PS4R-6 TaxID=3133438 RepID=UPI0030B42FE8